MFRAIGKLLRTIGYLFTAQIDKIGAVWRTKPAVVGAVYDNVIDAKTKGIQEYKTVLGKMIAAEEKSKARLIEVNDDIKKLERLKFAAKGKAEDVVKKYNGDAAKIKVDADYQTCLKAYEEADRDLKNKIKESQEVEKALEQKTNNVAHHRAQLQSQYRDLQRTQAEKNDTVAAILGAQNEQEINDMLSGISSKNLDKDLAEVRNYRVEAEANARISRELSGATSDKLENDFLDYADRAEATSEFDKLIGLTKETPVEPVVSEPTKISEN